MHPKKIDLSLERIGAVLASLDLSEPPYRVVTVAGTNGKGSCVAILESIYRRAGYSVGAFTSPHLLRFNERIRFDGSDASDQDLIELFESIDLARGAVTLSYFEASAVAAMLYFARQSVDVALFEVGLGGRLDAVNVFDADAALIVSIDIDHEEWLGTDRDSIAREKAGIIRRARPVIVADDDPPDGLLSRIDAEQAIPYLVGRDFDYAQHADGFSYETPGGAPQLLPRPAFGGAVQLGNAAACVALVESLQTALPVPHNALASGLRMAHISGRLEQHDIDGVDWLFDVAHNPSAAAWLRDKLDGLAPAERTVAVFAAMKDKDLTGVLGPFISGVDHWLVAPIDSERGASTQLLSELLQSLGAHSVAMHEDVAAACSAARSATRSGDRALVFGSFYTVGPAMAALGLYSPPLSGG